MAGGSVQSVDRAFAVLRQIASEPGGISDVARAIDLPVSTVARLLGTLESLGAVVRVGESNTYGIGDGIRTLVDAMDASATLVTRARPILAELVAQSGETSGISVIDGNEVVYLDHVETENEVTLRDWTGTRLPLHVVSSGLVLLAAQPKRFVDSYLATPPARFTELSVTQPAVIRRRLSNIRRRGSVWTRGEYDDGITSVAAPVVDLNGATVAAIHCHGPSYRFPGDRGTEGFDAYVLEAARKLATMLPYQPPTSLPDPKARR